MNATEKVWKKGVGEFKRFGTSNSNNLCYHMPQLTYH